MELSGADWIELGLAVLLGGLAWITRPFLEPLAARLAGRTRWCMLALAVAPVALRLALLKHHPVPSPNIYDEFAHLLVADTLRHLRFANPVHPLHRFFETFFTLQEPSYSSIYPLGPGLIMALGRAVFGTPWAGVLLGTAAFCALCYWMLRAWTTPLWALIGGVLAVIEFGPLSEWTNTYWGGSVAACAGCLVFGALPRLKKSPNRRDAILLGAGLGLHLLTRPYESIFLVLSAILFFAPFRKADIQTYIRIAGIAALATLPAIALMLIQNKQVTGSWTTLPYTLSQQQYGVPTSLTFQAAPVPHRDLTPQQALEYRSQMSYREKNGETLRSYLLRLEYRVRYYRFFFLPALYLILPFFFRSLREYRFVWTALTLLIFALGANFYPFFYPHYIAALTCLFVLVSVTGLRELCRLPIATGREAAWIVLALCGAHFVLWYGVHLFDPPEMLQFETWDVINHTNPERRIAVNRDLDDLPGEQLVIVRYLPRHLFQEEWVYNQADIDSAKVVWARDLGPEQDQELLRYYPNRTAWLLEPDAQPPRLTPYPR
ncbi:MAG TPA: hypothetical protein VGG72_12370 [Bryobacteraceae bacterium]|jgi:hypothetical protein